MMVVVKRYTQGVPTQMLKNYDNTANTNDGSCEWTGCTDPTATNQVVLGEGVEGTINSDNSLCDYSQNVPNNPIVVGAPSGPVMRTESECEESEMKVAGKCIKKNLVYIAAGLVLYYAYSKGMFSKLTKK